MAKQRKLKVALFIDSSDPGGAETLVINLAKAYQAMSIVVEIWHFGNEWLVQAAEENGLEAVQLDDRYFRRVYWLPIFALYMSRLIRKRDVSVVHSHLYGAVIAAAPAACLAGIRHVGTLHDLYSLSDRHGRVVGLRVAEILGARLVCVARVIESTIRKRGKSSWRYLRTVHNGISVPQTLHAAGVRDEVWRRAETRFVCVARLVQIKNIDVLVRAAAMLDHDLVFRVSIAGEGPDRGVLERLAAELGISDHIDFLGFRDDVEALLAESHCFVLPSRSEGLSCSIMEAMRAGLPVIATDVGGNSELIRHDINGILLGSGDVDALASEMRRVIKMRHWAIAAGQAARNTILSNFSFEQMSNSYLRLYENDD